ncbi:arsenic resistance protein [Corticibacter populi]|uniref:Arsenic resistance protein n=1 Tax=Corticibacter populi TaxID=1550736 RepID=A0A3M6QP81_9BURK|nr:arsenic resistance protein [Corticibacter populi]RMX04858.1 arsenic resistance protein [Corticibacter populi]RZS33720.1 ACR3 family arsenite efflux pump ArsB [Corticibacter populi]
MQRELLEKYQLVVYLLAIGTGLSAGLIWPAGAGLLEALLWPVLAVLLFATFAQTPLTRLRAALFDRVFLGCALFGNFVAVPLLVWLLLPLAGDDMALHLGVALVLLVPCTDWFITFTQLAGGDVRRAIAFTPLSLVLQVLLLPLYLWLFFGNQFSISLISPQLLRAFALLIVLPMALAYALQRWWPQRPGHPHPATVLAWLPVPLLALVVGLIAAAQATVVLQALPVLLGLLPVFVAFLVMALLCAWGLARTCKLPAASGRTLMFSLGTRNSFVVLPLALTLGPELALVSTVVVLQSLVELLGLVAYLWLAPRLFPQAPAAHGAV